MRLEGLEFQELACLVKEKLSLVVGTGVVETVDRHIMRRVTPYLCCFIDDKPCVRFLL